jgi:prepilin-type processing-associated H-X9-DG protein
MKNISISSAISVLAVVVILFFIVAPNLHWTHSNAKRTHCMCNLMQIGKMVKLYSEEHSGACPASLQDLTNFCTNPRLYICMSSGHKPGSITNISDWTDYTFIPNSGTNMVLAFCPPKNHGGKGGNIMFVDGSVCWYSAEPFASVLKNGPGRALTRE